MNKIRIVCMLFLLWSITGELYAQTGAVGNKMNLQQCIETAIANNADVLQRQLLAESDKADWKQSKMNLLPSLNAAAGHSFNQGRSIDPYTNSPVTQSFNSANYGVSSNVVLFNGLALQNNIKVNSLNYQASVMDWQLEKDNLAINVILSYLQVLNNTDQLEQARNQMELTGKQVERLDVLHKEGAVRPADLSDMKGQYAVDQLDIINTRNALESARLNLCRLMNIPYNKDLQVEKIDPEMFATRNEETPEQIYQAALTHLPLVKAVDLRVQSAQKNVKVTKGMLYPTLSFGGRATTSYSSVAYQNNYLNTVYVPTSDSAIVNSVKYPVYSFRDVFSPLQRIGYKDQLDNNLYTSVGFNLSIPLFNSLIQRTRVKQAKISLKSSELTAKTTRTRVSQDIDQAYINMNSASERYKVLIDQVNSFTESFRIAGILFAQGVGNSVDYLIAKNNLDRSNINLIIAKYDYVLRSKILDYYSGKKLW